MKSNIAIAPKNATLAGFNLIFTSSRVPWIETPQSTLAKFADRNETQLIDRRRLQTRWGTDGRIIQQGCSDLTVRDLVALEASFISRIT
ncbi:MAG: hypothetical protein ACREAB_19995, partial [Blastocatellia bacterium]